MSITAILNFSTFLRPDFFSMAMATESSSSTILRSNSSVSVRMKCSSESNEPVKCWYFDLKARCAVRMSLMRSMTDASRDLSCASKRIGVEICL